MTRLRIIPVSSAAASALVATALAATPATAGSATAPAAISVDWETRSLRYTAGEGQANDLYATWMGEGTGIRRIGFKDVVPIRIGDHCAYLDPADDTFVVCELPTGGSLPDDIRVSLGDGDDGFFTNDPGVSAVHGGPGHDDLHAHTAHLVTGGDGDDMLMGGVVMEGGAGMDHLVGEGTDETFFGGPGDDMIEGYGGADTVLGSSGDDEITGGDGDDALFGGLGDDTLSGDGGRDLILGGPGRDRITP
ncbi:calcium-binding protein [Streptomyces sp. SBT349]|uniref:calcium-binding protein n=1 Tax=Streptomyces sp. SBT349 TaxID=1580539 RepID=UPI00066A26E6|nr:calcium-binding protein [Streptomyces sp. SBT349]